MPVAIMRLLVFGFEAIRLAAGRSGGNDGRTRANGFNSTPTQSTLGSGDLTVVPI
jgi:hypothetical protein